MSENKFKQIAETIESRIIDGIYPPNFKLPPHRELANELSTTPATIAKAYKLLADKKRVEPFVGRGTFVCGESCLDQVIQSSEDNGDYNFSILQPCLSHNVQPLKEALEKAASQLTSDLIGYTEHSGHETHRLAGVNWAKEYGLVGGNANNTLLTNGAQHALSLLIEVLTKPGDTIAIEALVYPGIIAIASLLGRQIVGVALDDKGMSPTDLTRVIKQHKPKLVIVIPSFQNPTGITMPTARRKEIADVIIKNNIYLIEDDIYGFLNEKVIPAICNWLPEQGFHITSLSKAISPAIRCGFVKVPDIYISNVGAQIRASIWLSSPINYIAASDMIETGVAYQLANYQREIALRRQEMVYEVFGNSYLKTDGYHVWLPLMAHWQQDQFVLEAKNRGLIVSSGSYFNATDTHLNHVRLSLMSINSDEKFKKGLKALFELLNSNNKTMFPF
ncbi:PLP-dependent aminotransferase family protein [Aliivibrio sp. SR45-2]|uniref:aminotransferase-like domain-containing protein n=1 Tax=Aliivibrio sp. SR45-2 TaxID=2760931 RepID=UPI0015FBCE58|nr:PLP-dependent aminotransferase family protein [Aliivibrio sp. SR45-2]MBB1313550.1 PLP-dependent aminotransferase family protein [Aliivibrio sp. SR45-2]